MYEYRAKLIRVIDGDTIDVEMDLGFHIRQQMRLRLSGINAPESNRKESAEAGKAAAEYLRGLLGCHDPAPKPLIVQTEKDRTEKYGRYLAVVYAVVPSVDGFERLNVNNKMVAAGHAITYS